jgi:4-hydroxy-4-methyl-2-oxoglutarate aldolase
LADPTLSADVLTALAQYDSPTVTDAINFTGARSRCAGYVNQSIKALYPQLPAATGYALTATFRSAHPGEKVANPTTFLDMMKMIDAAPKPRFVVLQDLDEPVKAAAFGDLMAASYQLFDCVGLLTNGAGREINRLAKLNFPCWTGGTIVSHGYGHLCDLNVPVTIGGLDIKPGDLLHGDSSGVVLIPLDIAPALPDLCSQLRVAECISMDHAAAGTADLDAYIEMTARFKTVFGKLVDQAVKVVPAERQLG